MLPDLRFLIGAVMATALLGVTLFGLAAAMHISHQSKVGPLEASRLLAYTPEGRHQIFNSPPPRADSPFANIPAEPPPVPLQQAAEPTAPSVEITASAEAASLPQPASLPPRADDADVVDERAVVDPPLPLDNDAPEPAAESAPAAPPPEFAAAAVTPVETTPAAPPPVIETPDEPAATPDLQKVANIPPPTDVAETHPDGRTGSDVSTVTGTPKPAKAKRKRAARKAAAKAKRQVRRAPTTAASSASTGYRANTTSAANRPPWGFWPLD